MTISSSSLSSLSEALEIVLVIVVVVVDYTEDLIVRAVAVEGFNNF